MKKKKQPSRKRSIVLLSILCAALTGRMEALSGAILSGAADAVTLAVSMAGMLCLWTGLLHIAEEGGVTAALARALSPVTRRLFPGLPPQSPALRAVCSNLTANVLGLGNAATPLGIAAMRELQKVSATPYEADRRMVFFVVLNTASVQLLPTMTGALRAQWGSRSPFDIVPAVWLASAGSLAVGLFTAWLLERRR